LPRKLGKESNNKKRMQDSLKISQNEDGTFTLDWDKNDPNWKCLNGLTSDQIQDIIRQAICEEQNGTI